MQVVTPMEHVARLVLVLGMLAILGALLFQVVMRYGLRSALPWPEEFSQFTLVGISLLGACIATARGGHVCVDLWPDASLVALRTALFRIAVLLTAGFFLYIAWGGVGLVASSVGEPSTALRIPMHLVYLMLPLGLATMVIALVFVAFKRQSRPGQAVMYQPSDSSSHGGHGS